MDVSLLRCRLLSRTDSFLFVVAAAVALEMELPPTALGRTENNVGATADGRSTCRRPNEGPVSEEEEEEDEEKMMKKKKKGRKMEKMYMSGYCMRLRVGRSASRR